jgi:adenylate cyclase
MSVEIERKFLVINEFRHLAVKEIPVSQYYMTIDNSKTIRLRIADGKGYLTIKGRMKENSIARPEWEFEIPFEDAMEMIAVCLPGKILKTRYHIPYGQHLIEVDVFHDKNEGLVIAEIELSSEDEQFEKPGWLGEEVTGRPEYYNVNLIK